MHRLLFINFGLLGLAACASAPLEPAKLQATAPAACIAQIEEFATQQTGSPVHLSTLAFSDSNQLLLGHAQPRINGRLLNGNSLERPEVFVLQRNAKAQCVIAYPRTQTSRVLSACECSSYSAQ